MSLRSEKGARMRQRLRLMATCLGGALLLAAAAASAADTLARIAGDERFRLGYRTDAPPLSFRNALGEADGFSVRICREVALATRARLGLAELAVEYVPVTAEGRFEAVAEGRVDILCGASTITLPRRRVVDFSLPTFIDGASVLFRADGPESFQQLAGHRVGVRAGTTTEEALRNTLAENGIEVTVVPVADHADGLERLELGAVTAYFADRAILAALLAGSTAPDGLRLSSSYFTHEPHGLALARGDTEFRLLVDTVLARLYRSGRIDDIFRASFGTDADPGELLLALWLIHGVPE